jgi:hypothetical protein
MRVAQLAWLILASRMKGTELVLIGSLWVFCFVLRQDLTMWPRLPSNPGSSCLYLLSAEISGML